MHAQFSASAAPSVQPIPDYVREPHRLAFRDAAAKDASPAVDKNNGRIAGVSLLTADREASGWGLWVDAKTLVTFQQQLEGRRLKAYATHGSWGGDGTLDEVGFWEKSRVDGAQLRADFQALDAWRAHDVAEFDTLFELAQKLPQEFGASLAFSFTPVWVRTDGTEVETQRKWRYTDAEGWELYYEPAMPADAVRDMPSVRCTRVYSADFVDTPAANDGLFRSAKAALQVDGAGNGSTSPSTQPALFVMNKEIFAKFGSNPALLAQAMKLHTENEKLTFAEIVARVEGDQLNAELAQLKEGAATAKAEFAKITAAGFKAGADGKTVVDVLLAEHASFKGFKAKADLADTAEAALRTAGFEAKDGKTAVELLITAFKKKVEDIATLRAGGTLPVETGAAGGEGGGKPTALFGLKRVQAAFEKQSAAKIAKN